MNSANTQTQKPEATYETNLIRNGRDDILCGFGGAIETDDTIGKRAAHSNCNAGRRDCDGVRISGAKRDRAKASGHHLYHQQLDYSECHWPYCVQGDTQCLAPCRPVTRNWGTGHTKSHKKHLKSQSE